MKKMIATIDTSAMQHYCYVRTFNRIDIYSKANGNDLLSPLADPLLRSYYHHTHLFPVFH